MDVLGGYSGQVHAVKIKVAERGQGLAGHMALDVEAGHEVVLHQALARVQPAEDHVLFQRGHHGAQGVGCGGGFGIQGNRQ